MLIEVEILRVKKERLEIKNTVTKVKTAWSVDRTWPRKQSRSLPYVSRDSKVKCNEIKRMGKKKEIQEKWVSNIRCYIYVIRRAEGEVRENRRNWGGSNDLKLSKTNGR